MTSDVIFLETDPTFQLPLDVLNELRNQNRIGFDTVISSQEAEIINVRSQARDNADDTIFGGNHRNDARKSRQAFARTFATTARMCMTKATNMQMKKWLADPGHRRNLNNIRYNLQSGCRFCLANGNDQIYTSKYDQFYPHFRIEEKLSWVPVGQRADLGSMMLIFRNNFTAVVEIQTTAHATSRANDRPGMFESRIHVRCTYRKIKPGTDLDNMLSMKRLCGRPLQDTGNPLNNIDAAMRNLGIRDL